MCRRASMCCFFLVSFVVHLGIILEMRLHATKYKQLHNLLIPLFCTVGDTVHAPGFTIINFTVQPYSTWGILHAHTWPDKIKRWSFILALSKTFGEWVQIKHKHKCVPWDLTNCIFRDAVPDISITVNNTAPPTPNTHPPTFVSHLFLVPWDPFGLDGAQSEAGQHVVQNLRQKNLQTGGKKKKTFELNTSTPPWGMWRVNRLQEQQQRCLVTWGTLFLSFSPSASR